jgi:ubiquinone/menaquinone biosynthesis C-methylase UbiE
MEKTHVTVEMALQPNDYSNFVPEKIPPKCNVLDVGCGDGQMLSGSCGGQYSFGIDIDHDVLRQGKRLSDSVGFICGRAEALPFRSATFDVVYSRVALPYTHLPSSLREIRRVLKPHGRLWAVLERPGLPFHSGLLKNYKFYALAPYIFLNTLLFHALGKSVPFLDGKYRGYQTISGITRALGKAGFADVRITEALHLVVRATA